MMASNRVIDSETKPKSFGRILKWRVMNGGHGNQHCGLVIQVESLVTMLKRIKHQRKIE